MTKAQGFAGRYLAVAVVLASVAGCGARWDADQQAEVAARHQAGDGTVAASSGAAAAAGGATTPTSAGATSQSGTGAGAGPAAAGGGRGLRRGDQRRRVTGRGVDPAVHVGVRCAGRTAEQIVLGEIATITGPVPGLGTSAQAAARAYVAYRNSIGGVCGRQLDLLTADDGNDTGRYRATLVDMEPRVLGLIGSFATADLGGVDVAEATGVPIVGSAGTTILQQLPSVFDINPPPAEPVSEIAKFTYLYEQGVRTAAVATLSNAAAVEELDQQQALIEAAGIQVVSRQLLPITTLSFDSAARAVANAHPDYLFFLGASDHDAAMARSIRDSGYTPRFEEYLTGYGSNYVEQLAGAAAEGTTSWIRTLPAEDGGGNAEQATYLQWMATVAPDVLPDVYAADAWAGSRAFFDALEQLQGPISREAIVAQLATFTSYDAGGFLGPIDLAHDSSLGCLIGMRVEGGAWRRLNPTDGFLC